jgi:hypothetical protein
MGGSLALPGLALLLALCVCGFPALAAATPPDPLWISGVFDEGDHDDVVSAAGAPNLPPAAVGLLPVPGLATTRGIRPPPASGAQRPGIVPRPVRAPPLA